MLGGKKISSIDVKLMLVECVWQLSVISAKIFFSFVNYLFLVLTHSLNNTLSMHFFLFLYLQGKCLAPTKEQGFLDFPITNISSLLPIAFTVANPVRRILVCFPPTQASNRRFSGWIEKKKKQKKQIHLRGKFHQVCT